MGLIETLSWAVVELQSAQPDTKAIKEALDAAFIEATKLDIQHDIRKDHLVRLVAVTGGY